MGRDVVIRVSYSQDAIFISRLKRAIELDPKQSPDWKQRATSACDTLSILLIQASNGGLSVVAESDEHADDEDMSE